MYFVNTRLTWEQIKEKYPHQNVGLINIEKNPDNSIKTAIVKCSESDTDINEIAMRAIKGELEMRYTHFEEDMENISGGWA